MSKRFCEQCGAALPPDAHFCEACGAAVAVVPMPAGSVPPAALSAPAATESRPFPPERLPVSAPARPPGSAAPAPPLFAAPHLPVRRSGGGAGLVLALLALVLLLLGGAGFWAYGKWDQGSGVDWPSSAAPTISPSTPTARDPDAQIPDEPPPLAGSSRPSWSAADALPAESGGDETLPPIPVTDDPVDLSGLKAAVEAANARDVDALYAATPDPRGPETLEALDVAIRALAKGLYRHQIVDGHGDLDAARAELRAFLSGLEHKGLGLSEDAVEAGVAHVGP